MQHLFLSYYGPLNDLSEWNSEVLDTYKFLQTSTHSNKIFLAHNPIWPNLKSIKLPENYDLYILAWGGEIVDVKWIEEVITYIDPSKLILLTDLEHVDLPLIKQFRIIHHHQLTKIFEQSKSFDINLNSYKNRKYKVSCLHGERNRDHRIKLSNHIKNNKNLIHNFDLGKFEWSTESWEWRIEPYLNSLINITSESFFETFDAHRPFTYLTEKTFKPIMAGCVGVHFGQHLAYKKLQEYGFVTADCLGLSYDTIPNDEERFDQFIYELHYLIDNLNLSVMEEIVRHNHNWYWNKFYSVIEEKNRLEAALILEYIDNYFR